jgi:phosphoglycolate phosphatase-like HAD superfamily hydrolase
MKYDLILWDFDGTLANTLQLAYRSFNKLASRHGLTPIGDAEAVRDMTTNEFLRAHGVPLWQLPLLVKEFLADQSRHIKNVCLYPGVTEVVRKLEQAQCVSGIVSSNSEPNIRACLRNNDVEQCFDFIVAQSRLLGKERAIRRAFKKHEPDSRAVLYIGDEVRDIEAVRQVGIDVAAVTWGVNSKSLLAEHKPDYLVERPEHLLALIGCDSQRGNQ